MENQKGNAAECSGIDKDMEQSKMVSRLADEMLDVCRGMPVHIARQAMATAATRCDQRSVVIGRCF